MKASELIGSQVLDLSGAAMCGTVCDILPSEGLKKIKALEILTESEDDCEKKYVGTLSLVAADKGVVTVRSRDALVMQCPACRSPINLPAYSEKGEPYGRITDVETDEKFNIISLIVHDRAFSPKDILTRSNELIVFRLPGSKTRITKPVRRVPKPLPPESAGGDNAQTVRVTEFRKYPDLIGKTVAEDVTDLNGATIAVRGEKVTDETVERARLKGAIVRLAMSAK